METAGTKMIMARLRILTILVTVFLAAGCEKINAGVQDKTYFVRDVVDGDTIELEDGKKVRYIGIDTPETMKRKGSDWVYDPEEFGPEAKDYNRKLALHKNVRLEFDVVREDKFDRWLAYVYNEDGTMLNEELLKKGFAILYTFPPNIRHIDVLLNAQNQAKREGDGFWGALKTISPEDADNYIGRWVLVNGEVKDVFVSPYKVFIRLGGGTTKALTAVIFTNNLVLFTKKGIDPISDYKSRKVELVGKIEYQNGPQIIIDNPSQIKILE